MYFILIFCGVFFWDSLYFKIFLAQYHWEYFFSIYYLVNKSYCMCWCYSQGFPRIATENCTVIQGSLFGFLIAWSRSSCSYFIGVFLEMSPRITNEIPCKKFSEKYEKEIRSSFARSSSKNNYTNLERKFGRNPENNWDILEKNV